MKATRLSALGFSGAALAFALALGLGRWTLTPTRLPLEQFLSAASSFVRERQTAGRPLPGAVSLRELITGGYLSGEHARSFEGADVSLSLDPDHSPPQAVRMYVRLSDGHELALFNDGSVQGPSVRN